WWLCRASATCLRLLAHFMREAASRTFWTAGNSRPMRMAMMAITTNSSISVKPERRSDMAFLPFLLDGEIEGVLSPCCHLLRLPAVAVESGRNALAAEGREFHPGRADRLSGLVGGGGRDQDTVGARRKPLLARNPVLTGANQGAGAEALVGGGR